MELVLNALIDLRSVQFLGLSVLTFIYLVTFPYTGSASFFDMQAIFDFTFLGIPRALDIVNQFINGTMDIRPDPEFWLSWLFTKEPINIVHGYNYSDWDWDYKDHTRPNFKSFFGPCIASYLTLPWSFHRPTLDKLFLQSMARLSVSFVTLIGFGIYCSAVTRKFGHYTTSALIFTTMSQFYFIFNITQLVPNCLSLFMVLISSAAWLTRRNMTFILLSSITITAFHSITIFLFLPMALHSMLIQQNLLATTYIFWSFIYGFLGFSFSTLLDTFMWEKFVWAQLDLFKDSDTYMKPEFGLSILAWYTFSALPQYLFSSILLVPFASRRCIKSVFVVAYFYLIFLSFLGFKDLHLVIYCFPLFNTCASNTIAITFYRFFTLQSHPESWLFYLIRRKLGQQVTPLAEFEAQEKLMDDQDLERRQRRPFTPTSPPPNNLPHEYSPVAPTDWLASAPPPYSESPSTSSSISSLAPEQVPLTSDVHVSFQPNRSPRGRQPPQSSPNNFLRRRGGLRRSQTGHNRAPADCTDREGISDNNGGGPTSHRPRRIPVEADSMIHSKASYYGPIISVIVTINLIINGIATFYVATTHHHRYPGGVAVAWLNEHIKNTDLTIAKPNDIGVYLGAHTVETGYTRFLQINGITYDRSPNFYTMALPDLRMAKYRNPVKSKPNVIGQYYRNVRYPKKVFDYKVIYFLLDNITEIFVSTQCREYKNPPPLDKATKQPPSLATIGLPIDVPRACLIAHELRPCPLIRIVNDFGGGVEHVKARSSFRITEVESIWILRCFINDV